MPKLKKWSVIVHEIPYSPPEMWKTGLHGEVYGHPLYENGTIVTTTPAIRYDPKKRVFITLSGSEYHLDTKDVDPDYEREYPGARKRLVKSLPTARKHEEN